VALSLVASLSFLGMSGVASAAKNPVGSAKWCANHPVLARTTAGCPSDKGSGTGSGSGTGTGGSPAPITVQIDPDPLVETGGATPPCDDCCDQECPEVAKLTAGHNRHVRNQPVIQTNGSDVFAVIQVETSPSFAGDKVDISSSQLQASCDGTIFFDSIPVGGSFDNTQVTLDDDGNIAVVVEGTDCAPGASVVEADLMVAPYYTALGTLTTLPPVVTPSGVSGYPTTSGTVTTGEVETGDTNASGESDVYTIFYVESSPLYAEQPVEIGSAQLEARCGEGWEWLSGTGNGFTGIGVNTNPPIQGTLDDDGNAVFVFMGASCAAGSSQVIADVEAGDHPTYTMTYNINPPQPTI
jgi:hypothetical protein